MIDAGSRFAGATDPAGIRGRLLSGGITSDLVVDPSSDGSGATAFGRATSVRALAALALLAAIGVLAAVLASPAHAAFIHKPAGTFQLPPTGGNPGAVAVDEETGDIYVGHAFYPESGTVEKFDSEGNPSYFTGLPGPNEIQTLRFEGWTTGDTFTLTCPNGETTAVIEWNSEELSAFQASLKGALQAKCGGTFSLEGGAFYPVIQFEGTFEKTNVPPMVCTKVTGASTCSIYEEKNGGPGTNVIHPPWNENNGYQLAVDNSGGPNQGVIYMSTLNNLTTCCPSGPSPQGGIHVYLPTGQKVFPEYQEKPAPGGIYAHSQSEFDVRACGVAVDANGDLVIAHGESNQEFAYIDKVHIPGSWAANPTQEPTLVGTLGSDTSSPCKSQIDSAGAIYTLTGQGFFSSGAVRKRLPNFHDPFGVGRIPPEGRDPSTLAHQGPDAGFALDAEDNLYGARPSGMVQKVDQSGSLIETLGAGELVEPRDVAVNKATGTVYVTDGSFEEAATDVHIYKAFPVPNSLTGLFSATGQTTGNLAGEVGLQEPGEEVTDCEFEYVKESDFKTNEFGSATKVPCSEGTTFTANEPVHVAVAGLTLEEPYYFRLVTKNANGASNGPAHKFVPHAVVDLTTKPASNVAPRSATLNASFDGNGDGTEFYFEYGHSLPGVYTVTTATGDAGEPSGATPLSMPISGLELETTYHYRVVAVNGTGTSKGFDETFTTPPAVANLTTEPATEIGQDTITLNGKFTGDGHDTHYYFKYGPTKDYGLESSKFDAGSTFGTTSTPAEISTYYGYSTYHYRVFAENEFGVTEGKDMVFTTDPAPLPTVTETEITELTPTGAKVSAMVAPNRWDASWLFEWGETAAYGTFTEFEDILPGMDTSFHPISASIGGLEPATLYHFRAVAFNFTGVTEGPDLTFRTPDKPSVESVTSSAVGQTTAHLSSRVIANSSPTEVHFEFGPTASYGSMTASFAIGSPTLARESAVDLTGLSPGTTYHYRVVGTNEFGTTAGSDQTFTTLPGAQPSPPPTSPSHKCPTGKVKKNGKCVPKHKKNKKSKKKSKRHG